MQPLDPDKRPKVHDPALNHVGLWIDDLPAAVAWLDEQGVRFTPRRHPQGRGGLRRLLHPSQGQRAVADRCRGRAGRARPGAAEVREAFATIAAAGCRKATRSPISAGARRSLSMETLRTETVLLEWTDAFPGGPALARGPAVVLRHAQPGGRGRGPRRAKREDDRDGAGLDPSGLGWGARRPAARRLDARPPPAAPGGRRRARRGGGSSAGSPISLQRHGGRRQGAAPTWATSAGTCTAEAKPGCHARALVTPDGDSRARGRRGPRVSERRGDHDDGGTLIIGETMGRGLTAFDIEADGIAQRASSRVGAARARRCPTASAWTPRARSGWRRRSATAASVVLEGGETHPQGRGRDAGLRLHARRARAAPPLRLHRRGDSEPGLCESNETAAHRDRGGGRARGAFPDRPPWRDLEPVARARGTRCRASEMRFRSMNAASHCEMLILPGECLWATRRP